MGGGSPSKTTTVNKTELPEWVNKAGQSNWDKALEIDKAPYVPYKGDQVADISSGTKTAWGMFNKGQTTGQPQLTQANSLFNKLGGAIGATNVDYGKDVKAGMLADANLSKYMNPHLENVESKSLAALNDSRVQSLMGNADNAVKAGAFGGSRGAIVDAVTNAESAKSAGLLSANLRSDAYNNAQAAASADIDRQYNADTFNKSGRVNVDTGNANRDMQADQLTSANRSTAASGLLASGNQAFNQFLQKYGVQSQIGQQQQQQNQAEINADVNQFNAIQNKELNDLNIRLSALGMTPYNQTTTSTGTSTQGSSGFDWAAGGLGLLQLFAGLSDDDSKTDKEKVGKLPGSDIDVWAYRYKNDPKTYPKVVGVMASDMEKKVPGSVARLGGKGGKRVVNYGMLAGAGNGKR